MKTLKFLLVVSICFFSCIANAQLKGKPLEDSLQNVVQTSKEDTAKVRALFRLAKIYASNDSAVATNYANRCLALAQKIKWQKGIGLSNLALASVKYAITDYATSIQYAQKAHDIFLQIKDIKDLGVSYNTIGINYSGMSNYTKAIENYFTALHCFESINDSINFSIEYGNLGVCYYYLQQFDKAIEYYKKSLPFEYKKNSDFGIASALDNIAIAYLDQKKYDSANIYDLKAIPYFIKSGDMPGLARIYGNRGNILMQLYDAKQAHEYYSKAFAINSKLNITEGIGSDYSYFSQLYLALAKDSAAKYTTAAFMQLDKKTLLDSSKYYVTKALECANKIGDIQKLMIEDTTLSEIEEKLGNYKAALVAFRDYTKAKDSIFNDENKQKLQALETERLTEVKDQQIKLLNQQKALETSEIKRQTFIRNTMLISMLVVALLACAFIYLYNKRRKSKFDKMVMEVEMKALRAQMNPHFIFNSLHSINKYVMENDKYNASEYLLKFAKLMRLILENSREQEVTLSQDLQSLELYMQLEALRFNNKFQYQINIDNAIDVENTLIPPMLLQPFVENSILHGITNKDDGFIKINVHKENEMIRYVLEDNGTGFKDEIEVLQHETKTRKSLGKKIINERLNIINKLKKVKTSVDVFNLNDIDKKLNGIRVELLLPLELAFD